MNIIEQLMVEHAALRLHFHFIREMKDYDVIYEVEDFVRNCHAKIEDDVVFPKLRETLSGSNSQDLIKVVSRLEADHRLIDKIGDQIKSKTVEGDIETLRKRILLYGNTVESHNASEESLIFPYWRSSGDGVVASRARRIIENFGLDRYYRITGFSEKLLDAVS